MPDRNVETSGTHGPGRPVVFLHGSVRGAAGHRSCVAEETTRQRCEIRHRAGFVEREFGENYGITEWGALYLDGEVSGREPLPAPRPPEAVKPGDYAEFG